VIEITCSCGRMLKAPDSAIGRKGRCKGCGQTIEILPPVYDEPEEVDNEPEEVDDEPIPDLGIVATEDDSEDEVPRPAASTISPVPAGAIPPEPWYYGFLNGYAKLYLASGLIQFGVILSLAVLLPLEDDSVVFSLHNRLIALGVSTVWLVSVTLVACPIFVAVDAARNIRATRYGTR
jgi:energy-converting hydrogenase Eha subunit E